jgi:hypothetical protein
MPPSHSEADSADLLGVHALVGNSVDALATPLYYYTPAHTLPPLSRDPVGRGGGCE